MYELTVKDVLIQLFKGVLMVGFLFLIAFLFGPIVAHALVLSVAGFLFVMGLAGI